MSFRVRFMYHPSLWVRERGEARAFFEQVFGRKSVAQEDFAHRMAKSGYPSDYCVWTVVADLWIDAIDPKRYVLDGRQIFPDIDRPGKLQGWGWYVDGVEDAYAALRDAKIPIEDQLGELATGRRPPSTVATETYYPLYMAYLDGGMRYEFIAHPGPVAGVAGKGVPGVDERLDPEWTLPPVSPSDPLGIERVSHHTVLTGDARRGQRLLVEVLGGRVMRTGRNAALETDSVWIELGGDLFEYAVPRRAGSPAWEDWSSNGCNDTYHAISFRVRDLSRAESHLRNVGVGIRHADADGIIVNPATALGVPWGFTSRSPIEGVDGG